MNPAIFFRAARCRVALLVWWTVPLLASAHPGHEHTDIPAVIRHPFVSLDHGVIAAAVLVATGAALVAIGRVCAAKRGAH